MLLLDNTIQHYAWGSRTRLSELLGKPPTAVPEAELWIGAHPRAPSRLSDGRSLLDAIYADPEGMLGPDVLRRFGENLPFLLKVLAVEAPLSLQAHPNLEQARTGFEREERAGVPLAAPERTYKDRNHKPELLCALTPFRALSGFRPADEAAELLASLGLGHSALARSLGSASGGLRSAVVSLLQLPAPEAATLGAEVVGRCRRALESSTPHPRFAETLHCVLDLWQRYPNDVGVVASLLLNHVTLAPLEAIYLDAGSLHAYLGGMGVEIMANSDNVLRGGLTPKHVDVPELIRILRFEASPVQRLNAVPVAPGEALYPAPVPDFRLSRIDLEPATPVSCEARGPELLLCIEGQAQLEVLVSAPGAEATHLPPRPLRRGQACFLPASCRGYRARGAARLFRATVG